MQIKSNYFLKNRKNFAFRCHRTDSEIFSVNSISFHPIYGTFCTAGSDGEIHFWDKDSKTKLKTLNNLGGSITSTTFSPKGDLMAYSIGYDWSKVLILLNFKGHVYDKSLKNAVFVRRCMDDEIMPKRF